jgi:hypothetical protein
VHIGYDERRAHALHAGSDMLLHPTRFEPFGLTPLYAMRYGAIPIGSRVGGLVDTVCDADLDPQRATGVLFDGDTVDDMQHAVTRAFALYSDTERWQAMQRNAMASTATGPGRPAPISRPTPMWPTWQYGPCSYRARCRWSGPPTPARFRTSGWPGRPPPSPPHWPMWWGASGSGGLSLAWCARGSNVLINCDNNRSVHVRSVCHGL